MISEGAKLVSGAPSHSKEIALAFIYPREMQAVLQVLISFSHPITPHRSPPASLVQYS